MRGIKLSMLCTHKRAYFNVCVALDNVDKREEVLIEPAAGLLPTNNTNSRFSHRKSSPICFLEVTLGTVRCSFQRKHQGRLDHIYLAKAAKSTNDLSHTAFSFKVDGALVCKHCSWSNPSYVLTDKSNNFVPDNAKIADDFFVIKGKREELTF